MAVMQPQQRLRRIGRRNTRRNGATVPMVPAPRDATPLPPESIEAVTALFSDVHEMLVAVFDTDESMVVTVTGTIGGVVASLEVGRDPRGARVHKDSLENLRKLAEQYGLDQKAAEDRLSGTGETYCLYQFAKAANGKQLFK